jgi:hypothetical protein
MVVPAANEFLAVCSLDPGSVMSTGVLKHQQCTSYAFRRLLTRITVTGKADLHHISLQRISSASLGAGVKTLT